MKKVMIFAGLSVAALAAAAGIATAQTAPAPAGPGHGWDRGHASRDADNDGRISQAEFMGDRIARLTALDTNRDGTVSAEERRAGMQAHRAERQAARFDRLDADKNGSITRAEFDAPRAERARPERAERGPRGDHMRGGRGHGRGPMHAGRGPGRGGERGGPVIIAEVQAKMAERFAAIDTDRDGFLSAAEQTASREAMRSQWQERRAERQAARTANRASPSAPASE